MKQNIKTKLIFLILLLSLLSPILVSANTNKYFYTDIPINSWYYNSVMFVSNHKIMTGNKDKFYPEKNITRAEVALIMSRLYIKIQEENRSDEDKIISTIEKIINNSVRIDIAITNGYNYGSGVVLKDGLILTVNHVLNNPNNSNIKITFYNGKTINGIVLKQDFDNDIALVSYETNPDLKFEEIKICKDAKIGQSVIAIGNPREINFNVSKGIISSIQWFINGSNATQNIVTDTPVSPGNSGGGLFNLDGELVGIVKSKINSIDVEGLGFATPYFVIKGFME